MYDYIQPAKVLGALQWLKSNNPLYYDIELNENWLSDAVEDDAELWKALSTQYCSVLPTRSPPSLLPTLSTPLPQG